MILSWSHLKLTIIHGQWSCLYIFPRSYTPESKNRKLLLFFSHDYLSRATKLAKIWGQVSISHAFYFFYFFIFSLKGTSVFFFRKQLKDLIWPSLGVNLPLPPNGNVYATRIIFICHMLKCRFPQIVAGIFSKNWTIYFFFVRSFQPTRFEKRIWGCFKYDFFL